MSQKQQKSRSDPVEAIARTMREIDVAVIDILAENPRDVPFALLYHVDSSPGESMEGCLG